MLSKAARNEQRKIFASTVNTIGLASLGLGLLTPAFTDMSQLSAVNVLIGGVTFGLLHLAAHVFLQTLED